MMTLSQLKDHVAGLEYRPGWQLSVQEGSLTDEGHKLVIRAEVPNAYDPKESVVLNIVSHIPPMPDGAYFDQWLSWRVSRVEIHEGREWLRRNGKPIFDPHEVRA